MELIVQRKAAFPATAGTSRRVVVEDLGHGKLLLKTMPVDGSEPDLDKTGEADEIEPTELEVELVRKGNPAIVALLVTTPALVLPHGRQ